MTRVVLQYRYWMLPIAAWTAVVLLSLAWNWRALDRHADDVAANRAVFVFKMVESVRLWNARHGGVYAEINDYTPPNPYLEIPEREIGTPSGRRLTMINPAYMTRQLTSVVQELSGIRVHLTSLKPINPGNTPDPWERAKLQTFEAGGGAVTELSGSGSDAVYRFIAPLRTQQACLKCHEKQGYKVGDIRGGVSVSFAASQVLADYAPQRRNLVLMHLGAWLLLTGLSLFALSRYRGQMLELQAAKAQQDALVDQRTAELRDEVRERRQAEAQLRLFIEASGAGIYGIDQDGNCTMINPEALRLLGYGDATQLVGHNMHQIIHHSRPDGSGRSEAECRLAATYRTGAAAYADDDVFWRADGSSFPVEYRSHPLYAEGSLIGAVVTFNDITERKRNEAQLKKLSSALEYSPAVAIITDFDGRVEYVNPRFSEVTGYTADEVLGKNPRLWQSGRTPPKTYQRLWATIKSGHVWHGEVINKSKDGHYFWEDCHISPIRDEQGNITHFVAIKEDITERKEQEVQMWRQAHYDGLTGLPNRDLFRARLEQDLLQADQGEHSTALLYIDLDGFKQVNDSLGHAAGDELLVQVGRRLQACLRDSDAAARLGGDEFAVILAQVQDSEGAAVVARKILHALSQPYTVRGQATTVTASIGIALYPGDGETGEALLKSADLAMYRAKQSGRNRYHACGDEGEQITSEIG